MAAVAALQQSLAAAEAAMEARQTELAFAQVSLLSDT